jgi:hypothetical protein
LGALAAKGTEFVKNLIEDEALSRKKKGKLLRDHAESQDLGEITDKLRAYVEELERKYPKPKKLDMRRTAEASAVRQGWARSRSLDMLLRLRSGGRMPVIKC